MKPRISAKSIKYNDGGLERSKPKAVRDSPTLGVASAHPYSALEANPVGLPEARSRPILQQDNDEFFPPAESVLLLDNIAQLGTRRRKPKPLKGVGSVAEGGDVETLGTLGKRARAKKYTQSVSRGLYMLDSPLKKYYANTLFKCADTLTQVGTKMTSRYCNNRCCLVCNRIRTANLIKGYEVPLSRLEDLQFVTLTLPNVSRYELKETIKRMTKIVQDMQNMFQRRQERGKQSWQLVGIRKLECTISATNGEFHPHWHFLISGRAAAKGLQAEWLRRVETATYKAQDVRKATKGSEVELFKYFAKMVTKIDGKNATLTEELDVIFQAMYGGRVFQSMGGLKKVSEEVEELKAVEVEGIEAVEQITEWGWHENDWVNFETGEALTGYRPSPQMEELTNHVYRNFKDFKAGKPLNFGNVKSKQAVEPTFLDLDLEAHRNRVFSEMDALERERAANRSAQELPFATRSQLLE